jgi:hypothetical protein
VLRDRERRRERWRELQHSLELTDTANKPLHEDSGQLHPTLVWVPPEYHELETLF